MGSRYVSNNALISLRYRRTKHQGNRRSIVDILAKVGRETNRQKRLELTSRILNSKPSQP